SLYGAFPQLVNNPKTNDILVGLQSIGAGQLVDLQPPYDLPSTIGALSDAGISWGAFGEGDLAMLSRLKDPLTGSTRNSFSTQEFFDAAAAGTLPKVVWLFPDNEADQVGPASEAFIGRAVKAIVDAGLWSRSLISITYDDWGGWADHVNPPKEASIGRFLAGGRIPTILLGGPVPANQVYHGLSTHASIPATIERWLGVKPSSNVTASVPDLFPALPGLAVPTPPPKYFSAQDVPQDEINRMLVGAGLPLPKASGSRRVSLRSRLLHAGIASRSLSSDSSATGPSAGL
ncbi:MAG: hypothetical protein KGR26_16815, partial [Cyanobacteria bacterium REEB65]|nr:hypothetical protein [Cyanobacteria bacterium REEB65]